MPIIKRQRVKVSLWDENKESEHEEKNNKIILSDEKPNPSVQYNELYNEKQNNQPQKQAQEPKQTQEQENESEPTAESIGQKLKRFLEATGLRIGKRP